MTDWLTLELSGTVMIVAVIILRSLLNRRLPKSVLRNMWYVPMGLLLVPIRIHSSRGMDQAIVNSIPVRPQNIHVLEITNNRISGWFSAMNTGLGNVSWWIIIWGIGVAGFAVYFLVEFRKCWREFSTSLPLEGEVAEKVQIWKDAHKIRRHYSVRVLDTIRSPLTYKIFHPVILIPAKMCRSTIVSEEDLEFVLEHEFQHVMKFDELVKLLLILVVCIHWFNPYVWVMLFLANEDIEIACDERVLKHFGYRKNKEYATTLINWEANNTKDVIYTNFSTNDLGDRILAIADSRKITYKWLLLFWGVLLLMIMAVMVTSSGGKPPIDPWSVTNNSWQTDYSLKNAMYEYHNGSWTRVGGITLVDGESGENNSTEERVELSPEVIAQQEHDPEYLPMWQEQLPAPSEGTRALYDNWGEVEEIYTKNENGLYTTAARYLVQVK